MERGAFVFGGTSVLCRRPRSATSRVVCCRQAESEPPLKPAPAARPAAGPAKAAVMFVVSALGALMARPAPAHALFGSNKMNLSSSERITSGAATLGVGAGLGYLAWKLNRDEDSVESKHIREEVERLEKWKQEFMSDDDDDDDDDDGDDGDDDDDDGGGGGDKVSDEELMAALRDRLAKGESAPAKKDDVDRLRRMWEAGNQQSGGDATGGKKDPSGQPPTSP